MTEQHRIIKNIVFRLVRRHIAGSTISSALNEVRYLNSKGLGTTLTFLNEHVDDPVKARYNANAYVQAVRQISRLHLNSGISVRLSQIGYTLGNGVSDRGLDEILEAAKASSARVWLESGVGMTNDELMDIYREKRPDHDNLGVEIPISYYAQLDGIAKKLKANDMVRLSSHSYMAEEKPGKEGKKQDGSLLKRYMGSIEVLRGRKARVCVQEANEKLIAKIASSSKDKKERLIFQVPLGYNKKRMARLVKSKVEMEVYVPYGKDWVSYAIYRMSTGRLRNVALAMLNGEDRVGVDAEE